FPQGLVHYNKKGKKTSVTIDIKIRWREHGSGTWNDFDATRSYSGISKAKSELYTGGWAVVLPAMGGAVEIHPGSAGGSMPGFTTLGGFILSSTGTVSGIV